MIENNLDVGGAVVFWSIAEWTDRTRLAEKLGALELHALVPDPRSATSALRVALDETLGGPRMLIRPLASKDGFAVVQEDRGLAANQYQTLFTSRVKGTPPELTFDPWDSRALQVEGAYRTQLERVSAMQVSAVLVRVVEWLGGTRLRPSGAVYWIPGHRLDDFTHIARAIEDSAEGRPSCVYVLRHQLDADAIRAIRDAVVFEVSSEAIRIREEVISGSLGTRALETRQRQATDLRDKVLMYEELLSVGLDSLHQAVDQADQAAATASLLIGAGACEFETASGK